jgi:uncharacterized protein (TIGR03435 family)
MHRSLIWLTSLFVWAAAGALAQNARLEFEVASIKPNNSRSGSAISGMLRGDRFFSTNVTLSQTVRTAYGIQEFQIAGQPRWFDSERFDIEAKIGPDAKPDDWRPMLQSLLAERCKLVFHREFKEVSVLALVLAKGGSKLKPAEQIDCSQAPGKCGFRASPTEIIGTFVTMDSLATRLSRSLGQMVINKTDLKGNFDLHLQWTPEQNVPLGGAGASASPEIFAAIQTQLGLRLESTKAPVETLVIDRVERPSANQ